MGRPLLILAITLSLVACGLHESRNAGPDPEVLRRLEKGVNLSHAFIRDENGQPAWTVGGQDYALIRSLGLRHVRTLVDARLLLDPARPDGLETHALAELRRGVTGATAAGLMFVLALQMDEAAKQRLAVDPESRRRMLTLWTALAGALSDFAPHELVLELLNEPTSEDATAVQALMRQLVTGLRAVVPKHSLVVAGAHYSDPEDLLRMQPLDDPNLVYSFHFYHPHNFTHQGADWGWSMWRELHSLPYPSSPEALAPVLPKLSAEARPHAAWYGEERWNRDKLAATIERVAAWGQRHRLKLWCSEFGVYRYYVPEAYRVAWLRDVRELLEARRIAWTHWDYAEGFGLVTGAPGERKRDPATAAALGLQP